jgi:hypothetical protein
MTALSWNLLYLQDNPFLITPPDDPEEIIWAGMPELKKEIETKLAEARQSAATQAILNRGPFGGGKTHALRYYSLSARWPAAKKSVRDIMIITVSTPKQSGKPADDFYTDVLERIGIAQVRQRVAAALEEVGEEDAFTRLIEVTGSDSLGRAIHMLGQSGYVGESGEASDTKIAAEKRQLLDAYFLDGCTKAELRKLGLARNIEKAQDKFRVLAGLFRCFIGLRPNREVGDHSRVCLWIDEMEDFVYFSATQYRPFTQGLRDMIDRLPSFFTLLLNFTLTDPEELDTIEIIMGKALVDRITDHVVYREMNPPQAEQYVKEIMASYRTADYKAKVGELYPFDEDALLYIIQNLDKRTPRSINKRCAYIASAALQHKKRNTAPGEIKIDMDFVKSMSRSELDQELE